MTRLEQRLGARLLNRTTRRLSLNEAGAALFEASRGALAQIEKAELAISQLQTAPRGRLKVSVPMSFGILHIAPAMPGIFAAYPDITVDMTMDDRVVDLVEEGIDLAVRIANLADSTTVARTFAPSRMVRVPRVSGKARHAKKPDDLARHNCIVYSYSPTPDVWRPAAPDGTEVAVPVHGKFRVNNGPCRARSCGEWTRVCVVPSFYVGSFIGERRLQVVLEGLPPERVDGTRSIRSANICRPKVRAFIEFFANRFVPEPYWDRFDRDWTGSFVSRLSCASRIFPIPIYSLLRL